MKYCAVIPHFDHAGEIGAVIRAVRSAGLPVLVVDDASSPPHWGRLEAQFGHMEGVLLRRRARNGGKGAAVKDLLRWAWTEGYSHAVQIDADGQHDLGGLGALLSASATHPGKMICAQPVFGATAPRSRLYGRKLTNFWVAIETLSLDIKDAMCGYRIYPLSRLMPVLGLNRLCDRMAFDIEILVRASWEDIDMLYVPTPVVYPPGGVSHFRLWLDNTLISLTHLRLVAGMLLRLPGRAIRAARGPRGRASGASP